MHLRITSDATAESGIGQLVDESSGPTRKHFMPKGYGAGLAGIVIVLMCRDPKLNFQRRVRFVKSEKTISMDIMLDLPTMKAALPDERKRIVARRLSEEVPEILARYKIRDFDNDTFAGDLHAWIDSLGWR